MGMDLTLSPFRMGAQSWNGMHLARQCLSLDRDYEIMAQIDKEQMGGYGKGAKAVCKPQRLPPGLKFWWYADEGLKERRDDPYGSLLTYVEAGELAKVAMPPDASHWNKAVFAMMKALPADTPVVLWWH